MNKCDKCGLLHCGPDTCSKAKPNRNKSRHRPGYFTEYMRKYRARKAQERLNPSQAKLK